MVQPRLKIENLSRHYGAISAVAPTSLSIEAGSFTAILGPSGCGKSTLLRMIAGFVAPSTGTILIDGENVTKLGPEKRPSHIVFQSHGLFPHMHVAANIGFGLMIAGVSDAETKKRVDEALELVRLTDKAQANVMQLSGGQQQRVALARALVMKPKLLLLDEPLSALDLKLRQDMQAELARIHRQTGGTFLFVTHDQSEAFGLADRLIVMNQGTIAQDGKPHDVYADPVSLFVARFVGDANVLGTPERPLILRPENVVVEDDPSHNGQPAILESATHLGASAKAQLRLADGTLIAAHLTDAARILKWQKGQTLYVDWGPDALKAVAP